jgi:hypothetical protein
MAEILLRHSPGGKPFLEVPSYLPPINFGNPSDRFDSFRFP